MPRDTIIRLPLPPEEASIDEVIPSHVVVKRCEGVCHEFGNVYHECVPEPGARTQQASPDSQWGNVPPEYIIL